MPADLVAKVLTGDADRTRAGRFEDIPLKELPLLWVGRRWHRERRRLESLESDMMPKTMEENDESYIYGCTSISVHNARLLEHNI